jgi:hypothetical protein
MLLLRQPRQWLMVRQRRRGGEKDAGKGLLIVPMLWFSHFAGIAEQWSLRYWTYCKSVETRDACCSATSSAGLLVSLILSHRNYYSVKATLSSRLRPGLHQRQKRRVTNAAFGTRVWTTVYISVFPVAFSQFIYARPTVSRTQWRSVWDVGINATIDSCGVCQMALGTPGVENAAIAR